MNLDYASPTPRSGFWEKESEKFATSLGARATPPFARSDATARDRAFIHYVDNSSVVIEPRADALRKLNGVGHYRFFPTMGLAFIGLGVAFFASILYMAFELDYLRNASLALGTVSALALVIAMKMASKTIREQRG